MSSKKLTHNYCNIDGYTKEQLHHRKNLVGIVDKFNKLKNITKIYGKATASNKAALSAIRTVAENSLDGKPLSPFYVLGDADINRINIDLEALNKDIGSGTNLSDFSMLTLVPRAIADRYPNLRLFMDNIDGIANYEKNKYNKYQQLRSDISGFLKSAFLTKGLKMKNILNKVNEYESKIMAEYMNGGNSDQLQGYLKQIERKIGEDGGAILKDYLAIMEKDPKYVIEDKKGRVVKLKDIAPDGSVIGVRNIDPNVYNAAKKSRELLDMTGKVLIQGLRSSVSLTKDLLHGATRNNPIPEKTQRQLDNFASDLTTSIDMIEQGMKKGNYFPHYILTDVLNIKREVEKLIVNNGKDLSGFANLSKQLNMLQGDISSTTPHRAQGRSTIDPVNQLWDKNPLGALTRYATDVIAFNKLVHTQREYHTALSHLEGVDHKTAESMRKYLEHNFQTNIKGYNERPSWVNKLTRVISSYEFASKLGFGISTGFRNLFSGSYYVAHMGLKYRDYIKKFNEMDGTEDKEAFDEIYGEMGFKFLDSSQTADEMVAEGVLPNQGIRKESLYYDTTAEEWKYQQTNGAWKTIDSSLNFIVSKSAVIQRWTENYLRQKMFQSDFMRNVEIMESQPDFENSISRRELFKRAAGMSLKKVNKMAFAYTPGNKAPIIGGTYKSGGAAGQMLGIFMHYPMSFLNLQTSTFRKGYRAMKAGQGWSNTDVKLATGFMGLYLTSALVNAATTVDVSFWLENDTMNRIKDIYNYLSTDDEEERKKITYGAGASSLVSGPLIGDLKKAVNGLVHSAVAIDLINKPKSELLDFLTGYEEFADLTSDDKLKMAVRSANNQLYKIMYNWIPDFRDENPSRVIAMESHFYKTKETKAQRDKLNKYSKKIIGRNLIQKKGPGPKNDNEAKLRGLAKALSK